MRRKGRGAPVRNASVGLTESGGGTWKKGGFQGCGVRGSSQWEVGGVQGALTPLAVVAEAIEGCFGSHNSWARAVVAILARVPAQARRCVWGGDGILVIYC